MERLTRRFKDGTIYTGYSLQDILKKLGEYEDLEEQGLLLRLPIKTGDTYWELNTDWYVPAIYPRKALTLQHVIYCMERLGEVTFLTYEEAEAALEKMKSAF